MPCSVPINKPKATDKIIFISFNSNIYTNQLTLQLSTSLLNTKRVAITRKSTDECRIEKTGLNNLANITKVTKLDESIIFLRNKVLLYSWDGSSCLVGLFQLFS